METSNNITGFQQAAENAALGVRDTEEMRKAAARLDQARAKTKEEVGIVNVAVEFVREVRECE
jgi:hypothetical protein